jgi:hypothetical protein
MLGWKGVVALSVIAACSGSGPGTGLTGDDDDDATNPTDEGEPNVNPPEPEQDCDDEVDDDDDGRVDCDDSDCDGEQLCSWPVAMRFDSRLDFDANTLAEFGGYSDCRVTLTSDLERDRAESCPGCDRVFTGDFTFVEDDCPPEFERPTEGSYGVAFQAPDEWEIFGRVEDQWASLGVAVDDGSGTLKIEDRSPVEYEGVEIGELTSAFSFTP